MVYGKRNLKRKFKRTKRYTFRRNPRITRPLKTNVYFFKRSFAEVVDVVPTSGITFASNTLSGTGAFQLSFLPNYTEFTNLFDQYRIVGVSIKWIFSTNVVNYGAPVAGTFADTCLPLLHYCFDTNSNVVPASINVMREYNTYRCKRLDRVCKTYCRPRIANVAYESALAVGYTQGYKQWVDTTYPSMDYYGIRWAIDPVTFTNNTRIGVCEMVYTYYIQCKCVK